MTLAPNITEYAGTQSLREIEHSCIHSVLLRDQSDKNITDMGSIVRLMDFFDLQSIPIFLNITGFFFNNSQNSVFCSYKCHDLEFNYRNFKANQKLFCVVIPVGSLFSFPRDNFILLILAFI